MYILGLTSYAHEASCALIRDGQIKVVIEQERLNREKHTSEFPDKAIERCLAIEGIKFEQLDAITFFWVPELEIIGNAVHFLRYLPHSINLLKTPSGSQELYFLPRIFLSRTISKHIKKHFKLDKVPKVYFIEHHLCHAAGAFFVSPFDEAAILTIDGRGEAVTTLMCIGHGNKIKKLKAIKVPHSLGHLYAAVTDYLGFRPFFDEWKVMGMSAYGTDKYCEVFDDILRLTDNGRFRLNLKYFKFHTHGQSRWISDYFIDRLGPRRKCSDKYEQRHYDIAFGLQKAIEKAGVHLANHLYTITRMPNLCLAGGVILNCLMNKKIIEQTPFEKVFIQPVANDAGTSFGSALYYYHQVLNNKRQFRFDSVFFGPEYDDEQIEQALRVKGIHFKKVDDIAARTAGFIAQGKIVGWFQGKMEAGPRALGHRSIVVDPRDAAMKDKLNSRVKKREHFRPFAPSVLEERVEDYFVMPKGHLSPFMILVGDVREDKKHIIPAVTHADGTARVHTVNRQITPKYWQLIREFEKITSVPVLLNTSFNENEPIVCTPQHAVDCFLRTEFDILAIGDYLVCKDKSLIENL